MEETAAFPDMRANAQEPLVRLLVADHDALARSRLASCAHETVGEIVVLEAEDGAEAIRLGLQQSPDVAILDIDMPRLGGIEAALTLRELQPRIRLGLHTEDPLSHRQGAREHRLPLFSKLELDRTLSWLQAQVHWCTETRIEPRVESKRSFVCGTCGYGAVRVGAPERCPMCQAENAWVSHLPGSASRLRSAPV